MHKRKRRTPKHMAKRSFANVVVYLCIIAVSCYTLGAFYLQSSGMNEISPSLTAAWFSFWTVEILALAAIKTSKVKHNYSKEVKPIEGASAKPAEYNAKFRTGGTGDHGETGESNGNVDGNG